jgi:hypothetical protein
MYIVELPDIFGNCKTPDGECVIDIHGEEHPFLSYLSEAEYKKILDIKS